MNGALSDIWYQLNFNVLVSLEIITILKKSLFSHNFLGDSRLSFALKE